jgi:uncharacterized protein YbdZ (MbtH family)
MSVEKRKFTDEQYVNFEYFQDDETITHHKQKIVVTRKEHQCSSVWSKPHPIPAGTRAIHEAAIDSDSGFVSNYICLDCADEYFKEAGIEEYI